jgi:hypothetical protein
LLEQHKLGKYRARCVEEQVDREALGYFADDSDDALQVELGVEVQDIPTFREAVRLAAAATN